MRGIARTIVVPVLVALLLSAESAFAALNVVSLSPARHVNNAPATTPLSIEFDRALAPATVTSSSFRVAGRWSGTKSGTFSYSNGGRTVTFTPTEAFSGGEPVIVNLAKTIQASDGMFLRSAGYAYSFRVAAGVSIRTFEEIDVMSNRVAGAQTRIYGANPSDLDNDGYLDLATVNEVSADVRVCLNRGDGTGLYDPFLPAQAIGVEGSPNEPADFNNDRNADLCVGATASDVVNVLLGAGDGTFSSIASLPAGSETHGVVALDVDGDADMDIVCANTTSSNLALFINNGSGVFGAATFFEGGLLEEYGVATGDMNNDGITDLVIAGRYDQELSVMLGNGNGTFTAAGAAQSSGGLTWVVALDDLSGDGNLDATCANSFAGDGTRMLGNGNGTFGAPVAQTIGDHTVSTDHGDVDGDGDLDWVLSSFGAGFWRLYVNDGAGTFTLDQEFTAPSNPSCAAMYDIDNDTDIDLALTDEIADVVVLMKNTGGGTGVPAAAGLARPRLAPNPLRDGAQLSFSLAEAGNVRLEIFDVTGRLVRAETMTGLAAGSHERAFAARDAGGRALPSGVYAYRIAAGAGPAAEGRFTIVR